MDFAETDDQKMIRDMVRDFAESVAGPTCHERDKEQKPPIEEFKEFASLGFAGMTIPNAYGGQKLDDISEAIVVEELSRVDPSLGVMVAVHVGLCSMTIVLNGNDNQKKKYLPKLASGEFLGAYSLSEASSGTDAAAMVARASNDGDYFTLNGEKMWVTNGTTADLFVLFAKVTDDPEYGKKKHGGVTCFIVEKDFEGFEIGKKEDKLGIRSSDTSTLILENCKVPKENVLGEIGKGFGVAMNALDNSRIGIAAQALGIAQGAYEAALKYSKERETFGKPIVAHQTIGNYLAEMAMRIDAARLQVYKAAWSKMKHYEEGSDRHTLEASFAKLNAGDTAMWVSEKAVQILGGYGYTTEFPVERFFRDAKITQIYEGTQEVQRLVIVREIGK
jgi:acyl-CoA dehydrogenase